MAEKLENVLLGDTTVKVVEKINKNISQTLQNADDIEDIKGSIASAGKIDKIKFVTHSGAPTSEYSPDPQSKTVELPLYTYSQIDTLVGNLSSGMSYKGTLGTGGTITSLPSVDQGVKTGDTYKVITAGTYEGQTADVGDLFIASVNGSTITWTLVPSGDDGDVYADSNFGTTEQIIVSANSNTDGKKVKSSGKKFATSIPSAIISASSPTTTIDDDIPTVAAVRNLSYKMVRMNSTNFQNPTTENGKTTYTLASSIAAKLINHTVIGAFNATSQPIIVDFSFNTAAGAFTFTVDDTKKDSLVTGNGGYFVFQKFAISLTP
jgi:hypothetical protein